MPTARVVDNNGFWTIGANPISEAGIFQYRGSTLPGAPDPNAIYNVYRPVEELSDPECIASFKLLPWIDNHTMLGAGLAPAEEVGVHGVTGDNVFVQDGKLWANLKLFSAGMADLIQSGKKELSAGYRAAYDWTAGVYNGVAYDCVQRKLRGNHLALVTEGRCGPGVAVLDNHFTLDSKDFDMNKKDAEALRARLNQALAARGIQMPALVKDAAEDETPPPPADGDGEGEKKGVDVDALSLDELTALVKEIMPKIEALTAAANTATEPEKVDPTDTPAEIAAAMDARIASHGYVTVDAAIAAIADRDLLARQLSEHVGTFDHSAMTVQQVVAYGIDKLGVQCAKGAERATLGGYLAGRKVPKPVTTGVAMDGNDADNAVSKFLNAKVA